MPLKHLNLPINIKIPVTIYLHDSYTTKFDFMNYVFAKLILYGCKGLLHRKSCLIPILFVFDAIVCVCEGGILI